jgi:hypothetical protein
MTIQLYEEDYVLPRYLLRICCLAVLFLLGFPSFAHAYLDPGTGSYVFQLLIAGLVGLLFALKVYWGKIKSFIAGVFSQHEETDMSEEKDERL